MQFWLLISAATLSLAGALFHGILGHRLSMGNINGSNLVAETKILSLVSWHMFTLILLVGAGTLAYLAYSPALVLIAYPIILINAFGALMFLMLGLGPHRRLLKLPGLYLMSMTAALSWIAIS